MFCSYGMLIVCEIEALRYVLGRTFVPILYEKLPLLHFLK